MLGYTFLKYILQYMSLVISLCTHLYETLDQCFMHGILIKIETATPRRKVVDDNINALYLV